MKKPVLIFQRVWVNYREPLFRELGKEAEITVCFNKRHPPSDFHFETKTDFPNFRTNSLYLGGKKRIFTMQDVIGPLLKFRPGTVIIEFSMTILSNWIIIFLRPILRYKLIIWGHGYNRKMDFSPKDNFIDRIRVWWMNKADAVILYSHHDKAIIGPYLKQREKIFIAQNTLDTHKLIGIRDKLAGTGKDTLRKQLGFSERFNIVFLGRLLPDKEPDRLIDIFRILSAKLDSLRLHFVGDGPLIDDLKKASAGLNVTFWGSKEDDEQIGKILFASDLMVIPGYVGLAVVHSFCFDLPVVSQKEGPGGPFHSPEIEYLIDGKTGFLADYGDDEKTSDIIMGYLSNQGIQTRIRAEIRNIVENCCPLEKMVGGFKDALRYANKEQ